MSKLKLEIENLTVESFETSAAAGERGTVLGAAGVPPRQVTDKPGCQIETQFTGSCCDITLMISCVQTNCLAECNSFDADVCLGG